MAGPLRRLGPKTPRRPPAGRQEKTGFRAIAFDPAVRVVILVLFVVMLGFGIIIPILPLFARSFHVGYGEASLLISAFAFTRLVFDLVAGPVVDRFGERLTATAGVLIVGVSSILTARAPNFLLAVVFRGAGGAGSSILFAALYSYLLKVVPKDRMARALSIFYGTLNVGIIAGGPLGGAIAGWLGLRAPLYFYGGLCFVSALLYFGFLPDPNLSQGLSPQSRPAPETASLRGTLSVVRRFLRTPGFLTATFLNLMFFWVAAGGYDTLVPLFGREALGMSPVGIGVAFGLAVLGEFLVLYPAGSAADRIGRKKVLVPSLVWLTIMVTVVGWAGGPIVFGFLMLLLGLASGSTAPIPAAMLSDVTGEEASGTAVGVFRFAGDLGFVLGPSVAGVAAGALGFKAAFALMALPVLASLALVLKTPETLGAKATATGSESVQMTGVEGPEPG